MIAGANVVTVLLMLMTGFADYVNPVSHPYLSITGLLFPFMALFNLGFLFFWLTFKWRMAFIPFAGFLLAYAPMRQYVPLNLPASPPEDAIKVISYNVELYTGHPRYESGLPAIIDYLKQEQPDIVCLQEDYDEKHRARARMDSLYAYSDTTYLVRKHGINAVGIYSRFPILRKERIAYASKGNGSVAYYLLVGTDTLLVVNNHLESNHFSADDRKQYKEIIKGHAERDYARAESKKLISKLADAAAQRAPQALAVRQYIEDHRQYPVIVCGDFNDNPLSYARRIVGKGLTDCYVSTARGVGYSYNQGGFYVRIDNMMCSDDIIPYGCKIDSKIDASDHYPIVCWLKMPRKP